MNLKSLGSTQKPQFYLSLSNKKGKRLKQPVSQDYYDIAATIDSDKNQFLTNNEIESYLQKTKSLRDPSKFDTNKEKIIEEYKNVLQSKVPKEIKSYHSYQEMISEMKDLTCKHSNISDMISIGKTYEGKDIWALKISKKSDSKTMISKTKKPGIVITGLTHAREWAGGETVLFSAKNMLNSYNSNPKMKDRIDNAEIWYVPCLNPDGYEHSRNVNSWWRKNRNAFENSSSKLSDSLISQKDYINYNIANKTNNTKNKWWGSGEKIGVDLNRNYYDGNPNHLNLYRYPGDTPESTYDDKGASDDIRSDTYRGPYGNSENEIKAIQNLEINNKNIKAAIDFHSYGNLILYPWGCKYDNIENEKEYQAIGNTMKDIIANSDDEHVVFKVQQSADMYPATGSSEDMQGANGILGFTLELGRSFFPSEKEVEAISKRVFGAQMYLIDYVIENKDRIRN